MVDREMWVEEEWWGWRDYGGRKIREEKRNTGLGDIRRGLENEGWADKNKGKLWCWWWPENCLTTGNEPQYCILYHKVAIRKCFTSSELSLNKRHASHPGPPPSQWLFPWYGLLLLNSNSMKLPSLGIRVETAGGKQALKAVVSCFMWFKGLVKKKNCCTYW